MPPRIYLQEAPWKTKSIGELFSPSPMALSRDPSRDIKRGQLINSFLCLLPPCVFFSCFRWAWGPELVLRAPRVLEAAFLYKLGTELATRDWKSGRQSWLDMLRRACSFTAACPLGLQWKTRLSAANICICDSIVLSEDEISPEQNWSALVFYSMASWGMWSGDHPTPPWSLTPKPVLLILFAFQWNTLSFQKDPVPLCLI